MLRVHVSLGRLRLQRERPSGQVLNVQLLEIAVGNVVTAPVGDRVELNAVRELHLDVVEKPPELLVSSACFDRLDWLRRWC